MIKKTLIWILSLFIFAYAAYASCQIIQNQNNVTIYDFIDPSGMGAQCNLTLSQDGILVAYTPMNSTNLYYNASVEGLTYDKDYYAYISCKLGSSYFYSDCTFKISQDVLTSRTGIMPNTTSRLGYSYFMDLNHNQEIRLYTTNMSNFSSNITFEGAAYDMTAQSGYFTIAVSNAVKEDIPFNVTLFYNNVSTAQANGTMRWRDPFYVEIKLFHANKNNDSEPYKNDFQYVFLTQATVLQNGNMNIEPYNRFFDSINKALGYTPASTIDRKLAFWAPYANGKGKIKVYEAGNYTINLEVTNTKSSIPWNYEFIYPQDSASNYYTGIASVEIAQEEDQVLSVYISPFEISSVKFTMSLIMNIVFFVIWIALIVVVAMLSKDFKATLITTGITFIILIVAIWVNSGW